MSNVNATQVQLTNDASSVSKCSAVRKNYFKDDFIQEFVNKKKSRAPLIHLGYYTRAVILNKLITNFIQFLNTQKISKFQIISCGAGFDTTYWRLSETNLINESVFVEIDFPSVIQRKVILINQSPKLRSYLGELNDRQTAGVKKMNSNFYLLEADLSDIALIEKLFNNINVNFDIPTLFLSECVITYMKEADSRELIKWMSKKFKNCGFINYEQIHPDDGFGQVMLKHFNKLGSSLFSVSKFPDCESHYFRFKNLGFENSCCFSEWDALTWLTSEEERKRVFSLELFDEFEEFHLKCVHYVVAIAGNGIASDWITSFSCTVKNQTSLTYSRPCVKPYKLDCDLQLFRHISCSINGSSFIFGGCSRQSRSSKIYKVSYTNCLDIKPIKSLEQNILLDMVFGSAAYFELKEMPFICLYGGRTSPDKIWMNGSLVIYELVGDEFLEKLIVNKGNPVPRYRTAMVSLKLSENEAHFYIFGGRTTDLNHSLSDFWRFAVKYGSDNKLGYEWSLYKKSESWPSSRMSHSLTACPERVELYVIGGLTMDSSSVLNDIWKWSCSSQKWQKIELVGKLLPRYGHTSHLIENTIYLIGGVNTLAGIQPGVARIDLKNLSITEYEISLPAPETMLLFNHGSEIIGKGDNAQICIFGGGGNCFSFGLHLNRCALCFRLNQLS